MNELLKDLLVVGKETKVVSVSETASVEVSGKFTLQRGNFVQEFFYWARTYDKFDKFAKVDDYESEDRDARLGDLPIDNLNKFIQSLHDSGLDTIANAVGFTNEEVRQAMYQHIQQHKIFKAVYGKKVILWDLMTKREQQAANIREVLSNYEGASEHLKRSCELTYVDEEGNVTPNYNPTIEELQKRLEELS